MPLDKIREMHNKVDKAGIGYTVLRNYLRTYHEIFFYKHTYYIGLENIPESGIPAIIASNHQNTMNDALGIVFACNKYKLHLFTRADIFGKSGLSDRFFRGIGLLPAYRLNFDGEESLVKNARSFDEAGELLNNGGKIVIFPEACHQNGHWLGTLSSAYLKLAFGAAEKSGFQQEIYIVPSCNHYSDYFGMRNDLIIKFGHPISLKPYYDLYKDKPRTAQREVNKVVRSKIKEMMLDITDLHNYEVIEYIFDSYGYRWAESLGLSPEKLSDKLEADKLLSEAVEQLSQQYPAEMSDIFARFGQMKEAISASGLEDRSFREDPKISGIVLKSLALLLLSPIAVAGIWPSIPMYVIPNMVMKNVNDKMFEGSLNFGLNAMVILPLLSILSFIAAGILTNWWAAAVWVALFPGLYAFEWDYCKGMKRVIKDLRYYRYRHSGSVADIRFQRKELFKDLDDILSRKEMENTRLS